MSAPVRMRPFHTYRAGFAGLAIGREFIDFKGFTGIQWFIQVGRKVWVWRGQNRRDGEQP